MKPAIPVSPVRDIPSLAEIRQRTPNRAGSPQKQQNSLQSGDLLIDFTTPSPPAATNVVAPLTPAEADTNPFDAFSPASVLRNYRMPMPAEEDQQAKEEAGKKEERERKKQAADHREARRKSLANRRVSFAPEATLHTWNVAELAEDSTSSSGANATPKTHPQSSANTTPENPPKPFQSSDSEFPATSSPERPSTPTQTQTHDLEVMSPAGDPLALYRKSRRESGVSNNSPEANEKTPPSPQSSLANEEDESEGDATVAEETVHEEEEEEEEGAFDSETDPGDTIVSDNATVHSPASSVDSAAQPDQPMPETAPEADADAHSWDDMDDDGDMSMEFTEIQGAFQPWVKKPDTDTRRESSHDDAGVDANVDQENIYPEIPEQPIAQSEPSLNPNVDKENLVPHPVDRLPLQPVPHTHYDVEREAPDSDALDPSATQPEPMEDTVPSVEQEQPDEGEQHESEVTHVTEERLENFANVEELKALKRKTRILQRKCGWEIMSKRPTDPPSKLISLRYRDELLVTFNPESFPFDTTSDSETKQQQITVHFETSPLSRSCLSSPVKAMTLDFLRARSTEVLSNNKHITAKPFLTSVAHTWDQARNLSHEVRMLRFLGLTRTKFVRHDKQQRQQPTDALRVRCMLLHPNDANSAADNDPSLTPSKKRKTSEPPTPKSARTMKKSRLDIDFTILARAVSDDSVDVDFDVDVAAASIYGGNGHGNEMTIRRAFQAAEMRRSSAAKEFGKGLWLDSVRRLEGVV